MPPSVFPQGLDNFTNPTSADDLNTPAVLHSDQHANENDAIEAIEAWVGISGTSEQASHEYRIKQLEQTPPGASAFGVVGQDEGIFVGTGTILNVTGDNVVLSRSGTVLNLSHTNPIIIFPQEIIGVYGQNQGTPLGTGSTFNVNGSRLILTISGTSLELSNSPEPQDNIGILGRNRGTNLGTGTIIDFGIGLNAAITGTTLFVHPFNNALTGQAWIANTGSVNGMAWTDQDFNIQFHLGDGANVISTGSISAGYAFVDVPVDSIIESWSVVADATGSITANILKSTYAGFPPTTPLAGLGQPILTNLRTNTGNATGTASLLKTDQLMISVNPVSTVKLVTVSLRAKKVNTS